MNDSYEVSFEWSIQAIVESGRYMSFVCNDLYLIGYCLIVLSLMSV